MTRHRRLALLLAGLLLLAFVAPMSASAQENTTDKYTEDEVLEASKQFFGDTSKDLATIIEKIFKDQGEPNAYITGEEAAGAIAVGVRYGNGWLPHRSRPQYPNVRALLPEFRKLLAESGRGAADVPVSIWGSKPDLDELKRQIRIGDVIALRLDPAAPAALAALPGMVQVQMRGDRVECTVDSSEKRLPEILRWLADQGVLVRDCQVHEPDLEEVFVELAR